MKYKKREQVLKAGVAVTIAHVAVGKTHNIKDLSAIIEKEVGIPSIRSMSVLTAMSELIAKLLMDGDAVNIDGLGNLKASVTFEDGKPAVTRMLFAPSKELKEAMKVACLEEAQD